ncbi:MAG TPA: exonuclease domain-containing protein [Candidatus Thermoplasmatota archaeon]|nr:exonuclease domain-containing protein [Candidatus Thermoplasmatota archaeon]
MAGRLPLKVVLDTETTGLGPAAAVVQVALAYRDPATREVRTWSEVCDPGPAFYADGRADAAFRVNGLTAARVAAARKAPVVASELRTRLRRLAAAHGGVELRAYHVEFDRAFLAAAPWSLPGPWGACLMLEAAAALDPAGRYVRLLEACARLGVAFPGRPHDAASDAHAALLVHEALAERRAVPA